MKDEKRKSTVLSGEPCSAEFIPFSIPKKQELIRVAGSPNNDPILKRLMTEGYLIKAISACPIHHSGEAFCYILLEKY